MIFAPEKQQNRLKWCFESCKNGTWGAEPDGEHDVVCVRAADFDGVSGRLNNGERTLRALDAATYDKVALQPGDLVIEKSGGGDKQLVGRAVLFNEISPSVCSNFLARARPSAKSDSAFLNYLLLAIYNGRGTWSHIKQSTGIQNLDLPSYLNIRVTLPPLETQHRIAWFLDDKTARIDALIEKKRALLDGLAEKRQALITHAVTKGLNPDAPMKDSGIDWLGQIPMHWEVKTLKRSVEDFDGLQMRPFGGMLTDLPEEETGFKLYGQENTISGDFTAGSRWIETERYLALRRYELLEGDLVITRKGSLGSCRRVPAGIVSGIMDSDTIRIRPDSKSLFSGWALLLLHEASFVAAQIDATRRGAILSGLNTTVVGSLLLTIPPVDEQVVIIECIKATSVGSMEDAAAKITKAIGYLAEYRAALITAAVTGQLDVPEAACE